MSTSQPTIRTRFAPSPTGELHIGSVRTALFNYLFAKKNQGEFLLRIEDTDVDRLVRGAVENIIESLDWLNLKFDGEVVYQSKRVEIYKTSAERLVAEGKAYWCHCSEQRLKELRQEQIKNKIAPKYDGFCREKNLGLKDGAVIRLKIPLEGETVVDDLIRGQVVFKNEVLDDQVLLKSDGYPTYHLANVIDDHEMQISHVLRAEEWLSSTPKHIILYQAFGWSLPQFAHLPMILGPDKAKLSKRHGATAVLQYKEQGYLAEALINFMVFLGWNPGDEREIFSLKQLEQEFSLEKVSRPAAVFNIEKLDWLNGYYIRQMNLDELTKKCVPFLIKSELIVPKFEHAFEIAAQKGPFVVKEYETVKTKEKISFDYLKSIIALEQERIKKLSQIGESVKFFFEPPGYEKGLLKWKHMSEQEIKNTLQILYDLLNDERKGKFKKDKLQEIIITEAQKLGDRGKMLWPMRAALSGQKASPGPFEIAEILGKEKTLERIKKAIEMLK